MAATAAAPCDDFAQSSDRRRSAWRHQTLRPLSINFAADGTVEAKGHLENARAKINCGMYLPPTHVNNTGGIEPMAKRITQESGCAIVFEIFTGGSVAKANASVATAAAMGAMPPPSIAFVIFGWYTETPIGKLLIAGIFPGLLNAGLLAAFIIGYCVWRPEAAPPPDEHPTWHEKFAILLEAWPIPAFILA